MLIDLVQDIYLVETKAGEKNVPKDWIKSGGTKVRVPSHQQPHMTRTDRAVRPPRGGRSTPYFR